MRMSLRWKLAIAFFLIVTASLTATNLFLIRTLEHDYLRARESTYLTNANIIALAGRDDIVRRDRNAYYLARDFSTQIGARILILDHEGTVVVDSFDEPRLLNQQLHHTEVAAALTGKNTAGLHQLMDSERVMYVVVPVRQERLIHGAVMLVVGVNDIYDTLNQVRTRMMLISVMSALVAAGISLGLAGFLTHPIKLLTAAARGMEQGRLNQQVPLRTRDELGELSRAFNSMSDRLEKVEQQRREFVANASHELRSPLSSIKALSQALIDGPEEDPAVYREYLRDIDTEVDRLNRLVTNLLQLARMEEQEQQARKAEQNVESLVSYVATLMEPLATNRGIQLTTEVRSYTVWSLDRDLTIRILFNLTDNALRHTPPGGQVVIEVEILGGELIMRVRDNGEGIPEQELQHIFERFYRVDKARSRATGGTGLGLAIVRQAVQLQGGQVRVHSVPGRGTSFEIKLPH